MSIVCGIAAVQAEIKVGIAGPLSGSTQTSGEQQEIGALIDVLYAGGMEADIGIILRQAKKALPNLRLFSADGLVSPDFLKYAGEAGEGTYFTFGPDMRLKPEADDVAASIREEYDIEPDGYTLYSYGAVQAWAQAVEQAGSLETKATGIDVEWMSQTNLLLWAFVSDCCVHY